MAEVSLSNRGVSCAAHRYEALAQDLLSAKTQANHRPPAVRLEERPSRVEEALEWQRCKNAPLGAGGWGGMYDARRHLCDPRVIMTGGWRMGRR